MIKKMTIEKLADMVQKGFIMTNEKFQESDTRTDRKIDNLANIMRTEFKKAEINTDKKIDGLALMVQKGFEQTATKEELRETREFLSEAIKDLEVRMSAYFSFNKQEIDRLKSWMQGIEERISFLENKKVGKK